MNFEMKKIASVVLGASMLVAASAAMAEVGFQFRVPFVATSAAGVTNSVGQGFVLTFDADSSTAVGFLTERVTYSDQKSAGAPPIAPTVGYSYSITAVRMQKALADTINVGMDVGNVIQNSATAATTGTGALADLFCNVKFVTSKGSKVASFMAGELLYRMARVNSAAETDLGGVQLAISAGVNF